MLLIFLQANTPRTEYVFNLVFVQLLGIEYTLTNDAALFEDHQGAKIIYAGKPLASGIFIRCCPLLFENGIRKVNVPVEKRDGFPILFPNDASCSLGFDIFAAVFYMVSRYEEYLLFTPDMHGRFNAGESLAFQHHFLEFPVVNTWAWQLRDVLLEQFPSLEFKKPVFSSIVTYDIDIAYKFLGRSLLRSTGSAVKDVLRLDIKNIYDRFRALSTKNDPWDVYDNLKETIRVNNLTTIVFFLLGDYARYDKNIPADQPLMQQLIRHISSFSDIGIHPSYPSSVVDGKIAAEKNTLEKIANKKITKSRQHYLRFQLPGTYRRLLQAGIREDYSMGFTGAPGFRAGICSPFYFYDLENETATDLKLFPVTFMEGTFMEYMKISPREALENITRLIGRIQKVNGTFISIWHNNTVSNDGIYKESKWVHDGMIKIISGTGK